MLFDGLLMDLMLFSNFSVQMDSVMWYDATRSLSVLKLKECGMMPRH